MKRGLELSITTILLMILIVVTVSIIVYLMARNTEPEAFNDCPSHGGYCARSCPEGTSPSRLLTGGCGEGEVCCKELG